MDSDNNLFGRERKFIFILLQEKENKINIIKIYDNFNQFFNEGLYSKQCSLTSHS